MLTFIRRVNVCKKTFIPNVRLNISRELAPVERIAPPTVTVIIVRSLNLYEVGRHCQAVVAVESGFLYSDACL